tara:strand:+ start:2010 stop:2480 length:471 start_codon:yes stop_codon:yes gene_type:complete
MMQRSLHRCPICRTARNGMTDEEARPYSDAHDALPQLAQYEHTYAGGGYGGPGASMFFLNTLPISVDRAGREIPEVRDATRAHEDPRVEEGYTRSLESEAIGVIPLNDEARVRLGALAREAASHDLVDALRNLDSVSLREFQRRRARRPGRHASVR